MFRKRLVATMMVVAIIALACGGSASQAPTTQAPGDTAAPPTDVPSNLADNQVYRVDLGSEPPTLDPTMAQDSNSIAVLNALQRPLMYFDKDLKVVPSLAESVDVSTDAQTFTFKLRDATYSDGNKIVAGDLVYSWQRLMDPRTAAPYSYVLEPVVGASELLGMAGADPAPSAAEMDAAVAALGVSAPDDSTFVVKLATPATYFLTIAALWVTVPLEKSWVETPGFTEAANYVGSGPFKLDTWEHQSKVVIVPSDTWYGQKPTLTRVEFSMLGDPAAAQAAYEAGELDAVATPSEDNARVTSDPVLSLDVQQVPAFSIYYYNFNMAKSPTSNLNFRIALTQAIDKQALIDTTFNGTGKVANSFVMPGIPGSDENLNVYPFDLASAQSHMATALQELGVASVADLGKISLGFNSGAGHEPKVAFLAEAWSQAFPGLKFDQIGTEFATFLPQRHGGEYIISRNGWGADYPHASNQLGGLFTCGGGNNDSAYCNPAFDKLLTEAASEPDQDKQVALYKEAQTILMTDAPIIPLRFPLATFEIQRYVSGLLITPQYAVTPGDQWYETIQILKQ
ncbi:MAG: peptide ABC transporter substrate-binding protein [Chloroflexota bacterium]